MDTARRCAPARQTHDNDTGSPGKAQEQGIWGRLEQTLDAAVENTENAAAVAREGTPITSH
jgi:hypothetical protein